MHDDTHLQRAWLLLEAGRTAAALDVVQAALRVAPHDAAALQLLSECHQRLDQPEAAFEAAMAAATAAPDDAESHAQVGWSLLMLGRADTALTAFGEAIRLEPWAAHHLAHRALAHAVRLDRRRAEADIARARELRPDDARIIALHGQVLTELGRTRQARAVHAEALRLAPTLGHVHRVDARAHLDGGRPAEAAAALTRALAASPGDEGSRERIADLVLSISRRVAAAGWAGAAGLAWITLTDQPLASRLVTALAVLALGLAVAWVPWREAGPGVRSTAGALVRRDPFLTLTAGLAVLPYLATAILLAVPRDRAAPTVQLCIVIAVVVNAVHPFLVEAWRHARRP
ncbi:MAG: hypothetical protein IPJ14_10520 [Kineosporiaceae bacterium]|nr:hypothetical protein [Kineosporiaceae bacterium]